jgi:hypothetical protein
VLFPICSKWIKCKELIEGIKNLYQNEPSTTRKTLIKEKLKQLKELLEPDKEFTAVIECCIL